MTPKVDIVRVNCLSAFLLGLLLTQMTEGASPSRPGLVFQEFVFETAPFPSCHAATAVELADGELLCAFFGGTRERDPDVEIWLARKPVGGDWTAPVSVADGVQSNSKRYPTWNPVLFQAISGELTLFYNHSTRTQEGMGHKGRSVLNVALSRDGLRWDAALVLDHLDESGRQFSYPAVIQSRDGFVHVFYTWHRERMKHVVLDPGRLPVAPIVDGQWPKEGPASLASFHLSNAAKSLLDQ